MPYSPVILTKGDLPRLLRIKFRAKRALALLDAEESQLRYKLVLVEEQMRQAGISIPQPVTQEELKLL